MASFGWSAGDVLAAIKVTAALVKNLKSAKQKYEDTREFLGNYLHPLLVELAQYLKSDPVDACREGLETSLNIFWKAYARLEEYLQKHCGLQEARTSPRFVIAIASWSVRELSGKLRDFRKEISDAMENIRFLIMIDTK